MASNTLAGKKTTKAASSRGSRGFSGPRDCSRSAPPQEPEIAPALAAAPPEDEVATSPVKDAPFLSSNEDGEEADHVAHNSSVSSEHVPKPQNRHTGRGSEDGVGGLPTPITPLHFEPPPFRQLRPVSGP